MRSPMAQIFVIFAGDALSVRVANSTIASLNRPTSP